MNNNGKLNHSYRYTKAKGELTRVYQRRKNLLLEIKNYLVHFIASAIIKSKCKIFCIEDLNLDPRGTKGALAKAIYSMPDDKNIIDKAILLASHILGYQVQLIRVDARKTSTLHNKCGGLLQRSNKAYDYANCKRCNKLVNTHTNAAKNIRDKGKQILNSLNTPFPHARGMDKASIKSI